MASQWTLEDLFRGVVRSWYVLVGTIVAFALVAVGIFLVFPQSYTAVAQHTVEPISVLSTGSTFNTVNMETERVVATSATVLERAAEELDGATPSALLEATIIEVPRGSQVLTFQVTTRSASDSAEWANALARAYGEQRTANARTVVEQTAAELSTSIQRLQTLYDSQPPDSSERAATQLQLQALLDQQARLTATPFFAGILVTPATEPSSSNRPSMLVFVAAGVFLGLLLGGIASLIVSRVRGGAETTYRRVKKKEAAPEPAASSLALGDRQRKERLRVAREESPPVAAVESDQPAEAAEPAADERATAAQPATTQPL